MHWAADLIGLPWQPGAVGPRAFDCRGLVQECARRRRLPAVPEVAEAHGSAWRVVAEGQADDLVTMQGPDGPHVGFMVRANGRVGVLHANGHEANSGPVGMVEFQPLRDVTAHGYGRFKFWRASCTT